MQLLGGKLDINLIWFILAFFSVWMIIFGGLVNSVFESRMPKFISDAFRYGKTSRLVKNTKIH